MDKATYQALREAAADESLSYGELITIEGAFAEIPDASLRDRRENATADDMLDEIGGYYGLDRCPNDPDGEHSTGCYEGGHLDKDK